MEDSSGPEKDKGTGKGAEMISAKRWAEDIRAALGNGLRYDAVCVDGKSVIEHIVEAIQEDAIKDEWILEAARELAMDSAHIPSIAKVIRRHFKQHNNK